MNRHALGLLAALASACGSTPANPATDASALPDVTATPDVTSTPDAPAPADAGSDVVDVASAPLRYTWSEVPRADAGGPPARWGAMVADVGDGTAYVFGGTNLDVAGRGSVSHELWRFDGRSDPPTWSLADATGGPPNRYCGCLGWIPTSRTVLMVGGRNPNESAPETWAFDVSSGQWSRSMSSNNPPGVIGCQMAWSAARGALYLFGGGGQTSGFSNRTWRWDPAAPSWVMLAATGPRARYDDALVPMHDGRRLLMVAGARTAQAGSGFFSDVWTFDTTDETWTQVAIEGDAPPGRRTPWVSLDDDDAGLILAMGSAGVQPGETLDDLWRLDLRAGRWTQLAPDTSPPPRGWTTALPGRGDVRGYLFGGFDNDAPLADLWRLRAAR